MHGSLGRDGLFAAVHASDFRIFCLCFDGDKNLGTRPNCRNNFLAGVAGYFALLDTSNGHIVLMLSPPLKACRATRDFVSGGTPLGIVRQGSNEELSNCIVA